MRTGEVFALTWDNVDLEKRIIKVEFDVYCKPKDEKGRWYLGSPKTFNSNREIYINDPLLEILKKYKIRQEKLKRYYGNKYVYYHLEEIKNQNNIVKEERIVKTIKKSKNLRQLNFVFTRDNGLYMGTDIVRYPYKIIHDELGLKNCRFYDLRGSFATNSLRNGVEIKDVSDVLGHSNIETTENYYIASSSYYQKRSTEVLGKVIKSDVIDFFIKKL